MDKDKLEILVQVAEQNALFTKCLENQLLELRRINEQLDNLNQNFSNGFRQDIKSHSTKLCVGSLGAIGAIATIALILSALGGCI